jgi:hypothetical protein
MSTKILGFDVGIKNLAYCILDMTPDNYKLLDWGIINLDDDRKLCQFIKRGGEKCGKTAFVTYQNKDKIDCYLCKTHQEKYEPEERKLEDYNNINSTCLYEENDKKCSKKVCYKFNDTTYCKSHGTKILKDSVKETKLKKISSQSCGKLPIITLTKKMCEKLDAHPNFLQVDEVLIENQPSMLNPKMKTISSMLYSYFMINGIGHGNKNGSTISNVKFNSPSNKLKVNKDGTQKILNLAQKKPETYEYTKELGILYCKQLLCDDKINLEILEKETKQDDMCDAFLHGFQYYYNNKNLLNIKKQELDNVVDILYKKICTKKKLTEEQIKELIKDKPKPKTNFFKKKKGITVNI